jgi:undecaprenyl diphosphate synthase
MDLDPNTFPDHVAIIMDGNGRWAKKRHLPRHFGHKAGVSAVERTVAAASDKGINYLSLYAFSNENWKRPEDEVNGLMVLFREYILHKAKKLAEKNIKLIFAGRRDKLPEDVISLMEQSMKETERSTGMQLIICLNYGGRQEIIDAVNRILSERGSSDPIDEGLFAKYLYLPHVPDPDLIIRTSGENRLSNFWLWQSSYSEFYFSEVLWPDFGEDELQKAIESFARRSRRYGNV